MDKLSRNEKRFVAYAISQPRFNAKRAYATVFDVALDSAGSASVLMMKRPAVKAAIEAAEEARLQRLAMTADDVLRDAFLVANTSPNELVEWHIGACRFCWGQGHQYQSTPDEMRRDVADYLRAPLVKRDDPLALLFNMRGGVGYDARNAPHPDCPECFGEGTGRAVTKDTRTLSEGGQRIYAGIKQTKYGPEVQMRDRGWAVDLAARAAGISTGNLKISSDPSAVVTLTTADPVVAATAYAAIMGKT